MVPAHLLPLLHAILVPLFLLVDPTLTCPAAVEVLLTTIAQHVRLVPVVNMLFKVVQPLLIANVEHAEF